MQVVEVFADMTCPFTHVGLREFVRIRAERRRDDVVLRIRSWPLEVVNHEPLDAHFIAEEIADLRAQVAPDLFRGFSETTVPASSVPALALAAAANEVDLRTGERVGLELRRLLFEDGVDIADEATLRSVAADHGIEWTDVDAARVAADHRDGVSRGVIGSPHFFAGGDSFFCPALDISRGESGHLRVVPDPAGLQAFLAASFG